MNATISLDQPGNVAYTNLDIISGRVVVRTARPADISKIEVKLEGESRTRLLSPQGPNGERPKPMVEYHKILYRIQTVFPPTDIMESRAHASAKAAYTLPPGQHEYPFNFKIPFNNSCSTQAIAMPMMIGMEIARPATRHVKRTLPPTLSGFPGEAEIRYFVKVTVNRHSIFKENPRAYVPFNFFPIEPPRPPSTGSEVFARQKHLFDSFPDGGASSAPDSPLNGGSPFISIDARLPEPAVLTCNQDVPLRLMLKKLNDFSEPIYLQSLQISLISYTKIRAHDVYRTESNSWILVSRSNMGVLITQTADGADAGAESIIDNGLWRSQVLPNTVAPNFTTCNIERTHQLDIRIGLSCGGATSKASTVVLPLRLDTLVYSGIAPPPEVVAHSDFGANQIPPTPIETPGSMSPAWPAQAGPSTLPQYDDAPPSYEDAIAQNAPPVTGARPQYAPPPPVEDRILGEADEKKGWVG
ncbi:uncharacterized protein MYCFIDRAFT_137486 [Pseudocercospora fijiensis CIRAD86]|uniref:Arrestin-like N-terminal domain-containing protein n=1 Tax=Pseudocercospora fijiensis (strain CIRAD86) TaxID=383855 RepID=M3B0B4_PSEFD|nr:uncharacterized protein MYCFIDRAFT_137486 [Pseudocercospora fijiensis CIRAD86]EME82853.1 hypothetical protein MYCFIDRAFT_137486 [Pseudocercospora fijiensis CIRAD86]